MSNKYKRHLLGKDGQQLNIRERMDILAVRLDHRERARRRAEIHLFEAVLLSDEYQQSIIDFRNNELNKHKEQWMIDKAEKDRLAKILAFLPEFEKKMAERFNNKEN